jgi:acetyl-CoA acetyltransferase
VRKREVAIAGVYVTEQARTLDRAPAEIALESLDGALGDAGLERGDVDGLALDWPGPGGVADEVASWGRLLGLPLAWTGEAWTGSAGVRGVAAAAAAVSAGLCEVAVVGGGPVAMAQSAGGGAVGSAMGREFADPWGAYVAPQFALVAQRHMHEFGTTSEQIALVSATIRNNGHRNPRAVMHGAGPYTVADVLASRLVATPFHLLDLCIVAAGGAAVVLTTEERARALRQRPVRVAGLGMEAAGPSYANPALYRDVGRVGERAAKRAFAMADLTVQDVDVFCLYDPNAFEVIRQFEILGLCGEGEGGQFAEALEFGPHGHHPVNPEGGCLSCAWNGIQQMTIKVVEAVKQVRGECDGHQVDGARVAVASNAGAGARHYELAVLTA